MADHILYQHVGKVEEFKQIDNGIQLKLSNGFAHLIIYNATTIRVVITKEKELPTHSYAVIAQPGSITFNVNNSDEHIQISTDELIVQINKNPFSVQLLTNENVVINEDDSSLSISWLGNEVTTYKKLQPKERFIGLGGKIGPIDKFGMAFTNWNTDAFNYTHQTDPLYSTIPFYIGINGQQYYGIFMDNTYKSRFNFGAANNRFASFTAEGGAMDYYFIYGNEVKNIVQLYSQLTGKMELPPLWSLGLQQCRYSYYPDSTLLNIAQTYRNKKIPCDVIYYDIHYMDAYKVFTWHPEYFPDVKTLNNKLDEINFKKVVIVDPGIKLEEGYEPYEDGLKNDVFVKYPDGINYEGEVWPGWCHFPDFTNPKVRDWWAKYFKQLKEDGIDAIWNDMNEPATWGKALPDNLIFNFEGEQVTHKAAHNVYGSQMVSATKQGLKEASPNERPFVLTRAAYAGVQRYSAKWTGDNTANDEHLLLSSRMIANLGLCGVAFSGSDIGGFAGKTSPNLFARWMQLGSFAPFCRLHKMVNELPNEPWSYGETVEAIATNFIKLRYRLLPYLYSYFYETAQTGIPIARSLMMENPQDEKVYESDYENQFLFGDNLMICPVKSDATLAKVYLPKGNWYNFYTDQFYEGEQEIIVEAPIEIIPIFAKAGGIVTEQSVVQFWNDATDSILRLHVYKSDWQSKFIYYEDDGISYEYNENVFCKRTISFDENKLIVSEQEGSYNSKFKKLKIYLHGFDLAKVSPAGGGMQKGVEPYRFIEPVPVFDPLHKEQAFKYEIKKLTYVELDFVRTEIELSFFN